MVFFHKYFLFHKFFLDDFYKYLTCCSCVYLSLKVSNLLIPLEEFIISFFKFFYKEKFIKLNINQKIIFEISEKIFQIEFEILNLTGFDLNIDLPYMYIRPMKGYFMEVLKDKRFLVLTTSCINDSFILPLSLYYNPLLIFLACIYLLKITFNIELEDYNNIKWYNIIDDTVKFEDIVEVSGKMKDIYDFSMENKERREILYSEKVARKNKQENKSSSKEGEQKYFIINFEPNLPKLPMCDSNKKNSEEIYLNKKKNKVFFNTNSLEEEINNPEDYNISNRNINITKKNNILLNNINKSEVIKNEINQEKKNLKNENKNIEI